MKKFSSTLVNATIRNVVLGAVIGLRLSLIRSIRMMCSGLSFMVARFLKRTINSSSISQ